MAMKKKKAILVIVGGLFLLAIVAVIVVMAMINANRSVVMKIDGEKITQEEFHFYINRNRAVVADYFHKQYDAKVEKGFWIKDFDGETPKEKLLEEAEKSMRYYKAILADCKEKGLIEDITFSTFHKNLQAENERRETAISENTVVYGNAKYTEDNYFDYLISNLQIKQKEIMSKQGQLNPTDLELIPFYKKIREQDNTFKTADGYKEYADVRAKITLMYKNQMYDEYIFSLVEKQNIEKNQDVYQKIEITE